MTRARLRTAALLPVAVVAWLTMGTGAAMAAPSTHAAAAAAAATTTMSQPVDAGNANGQANGKAKGQDKGTGSQDTSTVSTSGMDAAGSSDHSAGNAGTSGDASQQQPLSTADQNSGGANGKCPGGPYCSTRDGSPSGNGNGVGKATGKPCAGCVGKADNKNPKGQYPNGSDNNAGYECDRNHGIGRTNPAHTGCTSAPTCPQGQVMGDDGSCTAPGCPEGQVMGDDGSCTTPGCPEGQTMGDNGECTSPGCPEGEVMDADGNCNPSPNCVPTEANNFCSTVEGEHQTRDPKPSTKPTTKVLGEKVTRTPSVLPFTGAAGLGMMIGTAALALSVGGGLMIAARRRRGQLG